jgi:hypothetical protein
MRSLTPIEEARLKGRRYNTVKMRTTLARVDARLTWVFMAWILFMGIVAFLYAWNPKLYVLSNYILWSLGCVIFDCVIVNAVKRACETFLDELCAVSDDPEKCKRLSTYEDDIHKPFLEKNDSPDVRGSYKLRERLHLPSRGLGHLMIVKIHWFILILYAVNYVKYFGNFGPEYFVFQLWLLYAHLVITVGRGGMLLKNSAYLFTSRGLLAILRGVIDWKLGGKHVRGDHEDQTPEEAIGDSMKHYRFEENKPPVHTCHRCVTNMAKRVADEVPMVVLPNIEKKDLLAKLLKLRERSPQFAESLKALLERLEQHPDNADAVLDEFKAILVRSPELVKALHALDGEHGDKDLPS